MLYWHIEKAKLIIQHLHNLIKEAIQSELEAQTALVNYLESTFQLQYFNQ